MQISTKQIVVIGNRNVISADEVLCMGDETICTGKRCVLIGNNIKCHGAECIISGSRSEVYGLKCVLYDSVPCRIAEDTIVEETQPQQIQNIASSLRSYVLKKNQREEQQQRSTNTSTTTPPQNEHDAIQNYNQEEEEEEMEQQEEDDDDDDDDDQVMEVFEIDPDQEEEQSYINSLSEQEHFHSFSNNGDIKKEREAAVKKIREQIKAYQDAESADKENKELTCHICGENIAGLTMVCGNSHTICKACLERTLDMYVHQMPSCPFCRKKYKSVCIQRIALALK